MEGKDNPRLAQGGEAEDCKMMLIARNCDMLRRWLNGETRASIARSHSISATRVLQVTCKILRCARRLSTKPCHWIDNDTKTWREHRVQILALVDEYQWYYEDFYRPRDKA